MQHRATQLEIFQMLSAFGSAIDGCVIERYDWENFCDDGKPTVKQKIRPWFRYASKPRAIHEAVNPAGTTKFPYITYILNGVNHRSQDLTNKNKEFKDLKWRGVDGVEYTRRPTPINLSVTVHIGTKKMSDMEGILAHFIAVCNPEFYIPWKEPYTGNMIKSKVTWSGDATITNPLDLATNNDSTFKCELSFAISGWIWRDYVDTLYPIKELKINYGIVDKCSCKNYYAESETQEHFDESIKSGRVSIDRILADCVGYGENVYVEGNRLSQIEGVYLTNLSGDDIPTEHFEPFCWSESLSAECPSFDAFPIPEFDVIDDNMIRFEIPESLSGYEGVYDVRATNRWTGCIDIDKEKRTKNNEVNLVLKN